MNKLKLLPQHKLAFQRFVQVLKSEQQRSSKLEENDRPKGHVLKKKESVIESTTRNNPLRDPHAMIERVRRPTWASSARRIERHQPQRPQSARQPPSVPPRVIIERHNRPTSASIARQTRKHLNSAPGPKSRRSSVPANWRVAPQATHDTLQSLKENNPPSVNSPAEAVQDVVSSTSPRYNKQRCATSEFDDDALAFLKRTWKEEHIQQSQPVQPTPPCASPTITPSTCATASCTDRVSLSSSPELVSDAIHPKVVQTSKSLQDKVLRVLEQQLSSTSSTANHKFSAPAHQKPPSSNLLANTVDSHNAPVGCMSTPHAGELLEAVSFVIAKQIEARKSGPLLLQKTIALGERCTTLRNSLTAPPPPDRSTPQVSNLSDSDSSSEGESSEDSHCWVPVEPLCSMLDEGLHPLSIPYPPRSVGGFFAASMDPRPWEKGTQQHSPTARQIYSWLREIVLRIDSGAEVTLIGLAYVERIISRTGRPLTPRTWRRACLVSWLIASKMWDDECYENIDSAALLGVPLSELALLESRFVRALGYQLAVSPAEYAHYYFCLRSICQLEAQRFPLRPLDQKVARRMQAGGAELGNVLRQST